MKVPSRIELYSGLVLLIAVTALALRHVNAKLRGQEEYNAEMARHRAEAQQLIDQSAAQLDELDKKIVASEVAYDRREKRDRALLEANAALTDAEASRDIAELRLAEKMELLALDATPEEAANLRWKAAQLYAEVSNNLARTHNP